MTDKSKIEVTLYVENLCLEGLESLTELWLDEPIPKLNKKFSWSETPEEFLERKRFVLPLLISKKLDIYEEEYPISDI